MTAHFWLSTDAITITQESIGAMTDDQARMFLAECVGAVSISRYVRNAALLTGITTSAPVGNGDANTA